MARVRKRTRSGLMDCHGRSSARATGSTANTFVMRTASALSQIKAAAKAIGTAIGAIITSHLLAQNGNPLLAENGAYLTV